MKKVLALSLIVLFPFIFLKLPNEEVSVGVLAPIFFALFAISCITEIYKRVKHKEFLENYLTFAFRNRTFARLS